MADEKPNRMKLALLLVAMGGAAMLPFACDDRAKEPTPSGGNATPPRTSANAEAAKPADAPASTKPPWPRSRIPAKFMWKEPVLTSVCRCVKLPCRIRQPRSAVKKIPR